MLFHISHLCDKTSTEIGRGHVCEDNIEVALGSGSLKGVKTLCLICTGNVTTGIFKEECTLDIVKCGGKILQ